MPRNLDRRVEALAPILDPDLQFRVDEILDVLLADDVLAWELDAKGSWHRLAPASRIDSHVTLQDLAITRSKVIGT
jgi:polyphosphate kinase